MSAILVTVGAAWFGVSVVTVWFLHRATRVLRGPEHPDRAPRHEALYVPAEWLVEL